MGSGRTISADVNRDPSEWPSKNGDLYCPEETGWSPAQISSSFYFWRSMRICRNILFFFFRFNAPREYCSSDVVPLTVSFIMETLYIVCLLEFISILLYLFINVIWFTLIYETKVGSWRHVRVVKEKEMFG